MQIKRDGLFFKFLAMFGEADELDGCKVIKLIFKNLAGCVFLLMLFFMLGFVAVAGLVYPFALAFAGAKLLAQFVAFSLVVYGGLLFLAFQAYKGKLKNSKAGELYDSWKNKYCLKVEVI